MADSQDPPASPPAAETRPPENQGRDDGASAAALRDGDFVLLVDRRGRRYLKRLRAGHRITIRSAVVGCDRLIGKPEGCRVGSGRDESFFVFRPGYAELVPLFERPAEPIFAKDAGLILTRGDIRPGHTVLEIGAGCGALSMALLRGVGPSGRLITYELRQDFADEARRNVERYQGPAPAWTIHVRDASTGIDERGVDRAVVDVPDAVSVLPACAEALCNGGVLVVFSPTVPQIQAVHAAVSETDSLGFAETWELLERKWHIETGSARPDHRMVAHTGFVTVVRRLARAN